MSEISNICKSFVSHPRSIIIAPAGFGKTHIIAESLNYTTDSQLILTHTNAGVAAIRNKLRRLCKNSSHKVETISGFAQKYVHAFCPSEKIPEQENPDYFTFIVKHAIGLFKLRLIKKIIIANYSGLFVDEYQDCTKTQHDLINTLSNIIPTHILGDPLQGIFAFNDEALVNFESDLYDYSIRGTLEKAWRWQNSNIQLGNDLKSIRTNLENEEKINLSELQSIESYKVNETDLYKYDKFYNRKLWDIIRNENNLLLIYPVSHNINGRLKIIKTFSNTLNLIEAMDGSEFYAYAKKIDLSNTSTIYKTIYNIALTLFSKSVINTWFGTNKLINKRLIIDKDTIEPIKMIIEELKENISLELISKVFRLINNLPKNKCFRKELFSDLCKAIDNASLQGGVVYESMKNIRNIKRHIGKTIHGKSIGTTLLTKGLEFETVVVLDAQKIDCPKNFYVAFTRASRRLIVFTNNFEFKFN